MLFKNTALFFLTLAAAILLLHNIVPHTHHHAEHHGKKHHTHPHAKVPGHAHHHHNETTADDNDLADILSGIIHPADGLFFLIGNTNVILLVKQLAITAFLIPEYFSLNEFILSPLLHIPPSEFRECISFYPCTSSLRGPPSIAV